MTVRGPGSYDCQQILNVIEKVSISVGRNTASIVRFTASCFLDEDSTIYKKFRGIREKLPTGVQDFGKGFARDVTLLFSPPTEEALGFGIERATEEDPGSRTEKTGPKKRSFPPVTKEVLDPRYVMEDNSVPQTACVEEPRSVPAVSRNQEKLENASVAYQETRKLAQRVALVAMALVAYNLYSVAYNLYSWVRR